MEITTDQVKQLRDKTGISVMQCKKALEEAGGDMEKALVLLRKKGSEIASKKAGRDLGSGVIASYIHAGNKIGVLIELLCETDFVAKNEKFGQLADDIAMHVAAMDPEYVREDEITDEDRKKVTDIFTEETGKLDKPADIKEKIIEGKVEAYFKEKVLLTQPSIKNPDMTIEDLLREATQKIGERIEVARFTRYELLG